MWLVCTELDKPKAKLLLQNKGGIEKDTWPHSDAMAKEDPWLGMDKKEP